MIKLSEAFLNFCLKFRKFPAVFLPLLRNYSRARMKNASSYAKIEVYSPMKITYTSVHR